MNNKMSTKDFKLFESLVKLPQKSLKKVLSSSLRRNYKKVVETPEYIYAVGDIPIALVAHMDTVFKSPPRNIYFDTDKGVIWSPEGLGADDRAGVFAILNILKKGYRPSVIFTTDEEIGAVGATKMVMDMGEPLSELKYIIQLDRRGEKDCVFYDCDNKEFVTYIEDFGFKEAMGSFSDISMICPEWQICGVNLSVGYINEHTESEFLMTPILYSTIEKVQKMLEVNNIPDFEYVEAQYNFMKYYNSIHDVKKDEDYKEYEEDFYDDYDYLRVRCHKCGHYSYAYNMVPVISKDGQETYHYCIDCCTLGVNWCDECYNAFEVDSEKPSLLCPICLAKKEKNVVEVKANAV